MADSKAVPVEPAAPAATKDDDVETTTRVPETATAEEPKAEESNTEEPNTEEAAPTTTGQSVYDHISIDPSDEADPLEPDVTSAVPHLTQVRIANRHLDRYGQYNRFSLYRARRKPHSIPHFFNKKPYLREWASVPCLPRGRIYPSER
jgi:hypothetical protein